VSLGSRPRPGTETRVQRRVPPFPQHSRGWSPSSHRDASPLGHEFDRRITQAANFTPARYVTPGGDDRQPLSACAGSAPLGITTILTILSAFSVKRSAKSRSYATAPVSIGIEQLLGRLKLHRRHLTRPTRPSRASPAPWRARPTMGRPRPYSCLTISTEISTAGIVPLFSSQCVVFLSSGQPTPGP
jgi:hypothetical protein